MSRRLSPQENLERFRDKYARARSSVARQIGREACGHDYGLNGYTTLAEARELAGLLHLGEGTHVLDLGSGRGWPAIRFLTEGRCRVLATDVPTEGLCEARDDLPLVAAADARALPFRDGSFDVVSHSDVFC